MTAAAYLRKVRATNPRLLEPGKIIHIRPAELEKLIIHAWTDGHDTALKPFTSHHHKSDLPEGFEMLFGKPAGL